MHAALITGAGAVDLVEFEEPRPATDGVVVEISLCGICGTDVHAFTTGRPYSPSVCGHEWVGTITDRGRSVSSLDEGDRVVIAAPPPCGRCIECRRGLTGHCRVAFRSVLGQDTDAPPHGGFAPRLAVNSDRVVRAHRELTDCEAAQVEPVTVALHGVRTSTLKLGDTAVVQGGGPIGLATLQVAAAAGAGRTIVVEPNPHRRRLARLLGATDVVAPGEAAQQAIADATAGVGADIVYECVGKPFAIQSAVDLARRGGSVCLLGLIDDDAIIAPAVWLGKEIRLTASLAYQHEDFQMAMTMIVDRRVNVEPLHSETIGLHDLASALAQIASGAPRLVKVLVDPQLT